MLKNTTTTTLTKNVIQFRKGFVNLPAGHGVDNSMVMSVVSELMQLGYIFEPEAMDNMKASSSKHVIDFHKEVIGYLKMLLSAKNSYHPFWPGFPQQVMEKSEEELWNHQITHYLSKGKYIPSEIPPKREKAFELPNYTIIKSGTEDDFLKIFTDLVSVNNSITPEDLGIIKWFVKTNTILKFPQQIPFKENLCTLASLGLDVPVKTVTDVLRIAISMSGGDISIPPVPPKMKRRNVWSKKKASNLDREKFQFKKFTRKERRYLLGLLEKTNCDAREGILKRSRWIRLGEILHPSEYKKHYPKSNDFFEKIREGKIQSWHGQVESGFKKSFETGLNILSKRPGEFMRKLDYLLRNNPGKINVILNHLKDIVNNVSNKVLYENLMHFNQRDTEKSRRIMQKGKRKIIELPTLSPLDSKLISDVNSILTNGLIERFSSDKCEYDFSKKVYIDERLEDIPLPSNMRSASLAAKPIMRGTRTPIGNKKANFIRAFVHWYDENGHEDIDLSGILIGNKKILNIGWNGHHNKQHIAVFSGDVRLRKGPCSEYIDFDINGCIAEEYNYVVLTAHNYNGRSFDTIKDCCVGYMERENQRAGLLFNPSTINNCILLHNESSTTIISIIDLQEREVIHLDIDVSGIPVSTTNINSIMSVVSVYLKKPKLSVTDILKMRILAKKGTQVFNENDADLIFMADDFTESYTKTLKVMGV